MRTDLLAGVIGVTSDDADRTVCACFAVGLKKLHRSIIERLLTSIAEIGAALRAGTNCGSCVPELNAILAATRSDASIAGVEQSLQSEPGPPLRFVSSW